MLQISNMLTATGSNPRQSPDRIPKTLVPMKSFTKSQSFKTARAVPGQLRWIPHWSSFEMFPREGAKHFIYRKGSVHREHHPKCPQYLLTNEAAQAGGSKSRRCHKVTSHPSGYYHHTAPRSALYEGWQQHSAKKMLCTVCPRPKSLLRPWELFGKGSYGFTGH